LITAKTYYKTQGMASIMRHDAPVDPSSWLVRRISRRRNPPHHLEPRADYAALIRPTRPTRPTRPCRLTPPSPRLLVTGSNPQFTSRRAFGPPQVLDISQNGISARGAVSYRVPILSRMAITAAPWLPKFWRNAMLHYFLAIHLKPDQIGKTRDVHFR